MKLRFVYASVAALLATASAAAGDAAPKRALRVPLVLTQGQKAAVQQEADAVSDGESALDAGDPVTAEADFRRAISIERGGVAPATVWPPSYYGLAEALAEQGKTEAAIQVYRAVIVPTSDGRPGGQSETRALVHCSLLLDQTGQWAEAVANFKRALPGLPDADVLRSACDFSPSIPQPSELAAAAHIALGLDANWTPNYRNIIDNNKAQTEYRKALQLAPNSDLTNYYYGYGLHMLGHDVQAQVAFRKVIKTAHGSVKLAAERALRKMKRPA